MESLGRIFVYLLFAFMGALTGGAFFFAVVLGCATKVGTPDGLGLDAGIAILLGFAAIGAVVGGAGAVFLVRSAEQWATNKPTPPTREPPAPDERLKPE
jgi:hypothetical protein